VPHRNPNWTVGVARLRPETVALSGRINEELCFYLYLYIYIYMYLYVSIYVSTYIYLPETLALSGSRRQQGGI